MSAPAKPSFGHLFTIALALLALGLPAFAIATGSCSDGTQYGKCSSSSPGYYCTGTISSPSLTPYTRQCPCNVYPGYIDQDGTCVRQTCSDGTAYGACSTTAPGKKCDNGQLVDKASACPCSSGYHRQGTTETCVQNSGCAYNMVTCSPDKECDTIATSATYNTCVLKDGCQYSNPACSSVQTCVNNICVNKRGCQYNNPSCETGKICRNNECVDKGLLDLDMPSTANSAVGDTTSQPAGNGSFTCCCMPAFAGSLVLAGAFAMRRKQE